MTLEPVAAAALVLALGVGAQYLGHRLRLPSIVLLLATGFIAGPWLGWVDPDALLGDLLHPLVALGVALVVFEGGLGLDAREVRAHGRAVTALVTVGLGVTWALATGAAVLLLGWDLPMALLLGAILTVSGPTVVLPLLRHVRPQPGLGAVARWEGILVDPIGAVLAVLVFEALLHGGASFGPDLLWTFGTGILVGLAGALLVVVLEDRGWVPDFLGPAVALALVMGAFAASDALRAESGLVAVTVMAVALANQRRVSVHHILDFKEQLSIVLIGALFILLAARVPADTLLGVVASWRAWAFLAVLVVLVRPAAVLASGWGRSLSWQERAWLSAMAPRGIVAAAVASLFALRLDAIGHPLAGQLVPVVFFVVLGTVVLYGFTAKPLAKLLGVDGPAPRGVAIVGANAASRTLAAALAEDGAEAVIVDTDVQALAAARMDGLHAVHARVHSRDVTDEVDMEGLGMMWAVTPRADGNALAAVRFAQELGRANVFQVAVDESPTSRQLRILWDGITYRELRDRIGAGWHVRRTPITEQFGDDQHKQMHPEALRLWVCSPGGRIRPFSRGRHPKVQAGDTLAALVPPEV